MTDADTKNEDLVFECELDAGPETVWRAVTIPEFLENWIGIAPGEGDKGKPGFSIVETRPCSEVRFAWTDETTDAPNSIVTIELDPAPEGRTFFRLTHRARRHVKAAANQNRATLSLAA